MCECFSVLTSCNDCKVVLLLLFVVKTSCRGDDPCDLINGEEVGGSGEQNDTIIAFITVSGRNLGRERVDTRSIIKPFNTHSSSPPHPPYTPTHPHHPHIHPTSPHTLTTPTSTLHPPHTLTNIHTLAILSPAGTFSRTDAAYDERPNTGVLSFTSRTVTLSSTVDVAGGTPSNQ